MLTFLGNVLSDAWQGFIRWPLRTLAPALGIMISTAALISIISVDEAWEASLWQQLRQKGLTTIQVIPPFPKVKRYSCNVSDALWLQAHCPALKQVSWATLNKVMVLPSGSTKPSRCSIAAISPQYPQINQWRLQTGRWFTEQDFISCSRVCLLGQKTAQQLFKQENPVGKPLRVNDFTYTVIGISIFPKDRDWDADLTGIIIVPYCNGSNVVEREDLTSVSVVAKSVADLPAATAQIDKALAGRFGATAGQDTFCHSNWQELQGLLSDRGRIRSFYILAMMLLLLIGCFGISSVLMTGIAERAQEIGLKRALGASLWQIYGALLVEGLLIAFSGGLLGVLLSLFSTGIINHLLITDVSDILIASSALRNVMLTQTGFHPIISFGTVALTVVILFAAALVAGVTALSSLHNQSPNTLLAATSQPRSKFLFPLTILQGALGIAVVLVLISLYQGLGRNEIINLRQKQGYNRMSIHLQSKAFGELVKDQEALQSLLTKSPELTAIAGSASLGEVPLSRPNTDTISLLLIQITTDFFQVCRPEEKQLIAGRLPSHREMAQGQPVGILNQTAAEMLKVNPTAFPQQLPLKGKDYTIIGEVVGSKFSPDPVIYLPANSVPRQWQSNLSNPGIFAVMREEKHYQRAKGQLLEALQERLHFNDQEKQRLFSRTYTPQDFFFYVISLTGKASLRTSTVGIMALLVACMGIFNLLLIAVQEDMREVGLRRALGATRTRIALTYAGRGLGITLAAILLGSALGWLMAIGLSAITKLPAYVPLHWMLLAGSALLLLGGTVTLLPAYLAARIPPAVALRRE